MSQTDQYIMYSITKAARMMHLGKDTLYGLISEGKIGTIKIGKREKIPVSEIEKFQAENAVRKTQITESKTLPTPQTTKSKSKSLFRNIKEEILNGERL